MSVEHLFSRFMISLQHFLAKLEGQVAMEYLILNIICELGMCRMCMLYNVVIVLDFQERQ